MKANDLFVSCIAALLVSGCSSKKDANSELQKASAVMAQPEQSQAAAAAEPSQSIPGSTAAPVAPTSSPAQEMNQAMTAYKAGDLDDAVRRLQKLRATPVLSAEKRIAVNDATAAVMAEIYALAAKGDARAIQAVKLYEQMQTHRD